MTLAAAPAAAPPRQVLFGAQVHVVGLEGALAWIQERLSGRTPAYVVTLNGALLVQAAHDAELRELVNGAGLVTPDGIGVILAARILGVELAERVAGIDLAVALMDVAARTGHRVFLLGGAQGVADHTGTELRRRYPGLRIGGTHHGFFTADEEPGVLARIRAARPDILLVALGAPRQEQWMRRWCGELGVPVSIGVGGSFDVISGRIPRAPRWMQRVGLEWLYRLAREPRRWQVVRTIPPLFWMAAAQRLRRRGSPRV